MDVGTWTEAQWGRNRPPQPAAIPGKELTRRLNNAKLWSWQEWILLKRVERACAARVLADSARIYDVSDLPDNAIRYLDLIRLITSDIAPGDWVDHGGSVNAVFAVSNHLVILATTLAHFEIEQLLDNLRDAVAAPLIQRPLLFDNPRALTIKSPYATGLLDYLRAQRTISTESLRAAGPSFADGVTEQELDACDRAAFGLLDRMRRRPGSLP